MPRATNPKPKTRNPKLLVGILLSWFAQNARDLPWRRTRDPYAIWVSEIMLQQTQVKTVIPYWERWMRELPTIKSLAQARPEKIHKLWEGLGYYTRVRNLQKAAQEIVANCSRRGNQNYKGGARPTNLLHCIESPGWEYSGKVPKRHPLPGGEGWGEGERNHTSVHSQALTFSARKNSETPHVFSYSFPDKFEDVLALPGIGRYTAGAICSIAFNQPTPILDGNVIRVLTRVFGIAENPKEKSANARLWNLAEGLVVHASRFTFHASPCSHLNQSLMELGALICTPRDPKCLICPLVKHCFAFQKNRVAQFPNLDKRPPATARRFAAFVLEHRGKFLVRQRPAGVVNAHLWEFPNLELNGSPADADSAAIELFGFAPQQMKSLCTIKHSITRYRITVEAYRIGAPSTNLARIESVAASRESAANLFLQKSPAEKSQWLPLPKLQKLSFPSAHGKILKALQTKTA